MGHGLQVRALRRHRQDRRLTPTKAQPGDRRLSAERSESGQRRPQRVNARCPWHRVIARPSVNLIGGGPDVGLRWRRILVAVDFVGNLTKTRANPGFDVAFRYKRHDRIAGIRWQLRPSVGDSALVCIDDHNQQGPGVCRMSLSTCLHFFGESLSTQPTFPP